MEDYTWEISRQYFNCLPKPNVFAIKILMVKFVPLNSFLSFIKTDDIVQIERIRFAKICGERRLFYELINICNGKSKTLKSQGSLRILPFSCFLFRSSPRKFFSRVAVLKFRKKHPRWIFILVADHRPSYLNYVACCPWNFEEDISQDIFD